jgi:DNA-binding response OmpR family regulator
LLEANTFRPHLVILDIMMPDKDGWSVCSDIRQSSDVPIIFLSALDRQADIVRGLDCGAVDYVTKPFSSKVLIARAQAVMRRAGGVAPERVKAPIYSDDYLTVDLEARRITVRGEPVRLTWTEYRLLAYLAQNAGQVLTIQQILNYVWSERHVDGIHSVRTYISNLRGKLEEDPKCPRYVVTEHGMGYRFRKSFITGSAGRRTQHSGFGCPDESLVGTPPTN